MPWMFKAHIFGSVLMATAVKIVLVTTVGLGSTWTNVLVLDWTGLDQKLPQISPWQIQPTWPPCWLWTQQRLKETPRVKTWLQAHCFFASREHYLTPASLDAQIFSPVGAHLHILDLKATAAGYGNDKLELLKALSADANKLWWLELQILRTMTMRVMW